MKPDLLPAAARAKKSRARRRLLFYLAGAAVLAFVVTGLLPKPIEVEVGTVTRGPLTVTVLEEGKTRIRHRYVVSPPVSGYLRRVPVRAGDRVVEGETLLAAIEPAPSSFLDPRARAQAEAVVKSAEATCMQRQEQIASAEAELRLAEKDLERAEQLKGQRAISVQDYDTAAIRAQALTGQLGSAKFALKVAEFGLAQAKAALLQTGQGGEVAGQPVEVRAPVSGYVLNVYEESARVVTVGTPIMEVGDPRDLEAEIELLSSDAVNVKPGAAVSIEQWGGGEPLHGTVALVEPGAFLKVSALGVEEQRVKVRVNFANLPEHILGDRYRVEARITTWSGSEVLQVPTGALFRRGNDWMAFVLNRGRATLTKVDVGRSNGVSAEVRGSSLTEGQRVIVHPPDPVGDGVSVKPRSGR